MENNETICACALVKVFGYEPRIALSLVENLGSASAVFDLPQKERDELVGPKYAGDLSDAFLEQTAAELRELERQGCHFLPMSDPAFPAALRDCGDSPAGLYYRSDSAPERIFGKRPAIAIVGTRDISPYGRECCARLVAALSQAPVKPVIVSGLAFGVDISAHMAALGYGLPTIGVLPVGIDEVYPATHRVAAAKIAAAPGSALVTDFPPGTGPVGFTFLRRNRIIAALSDATVLIESKIHGGGLITARLAADYGREVFALPGRIDDVRSAGCNLIIRDKTAEAIVNIAEAGMQLGLGKYNLRREADFNAKVRDFYRNRPEKQRNVLLKTASAIRRQRGVTVDGLCTLLSMPYAEVSTLVITLQSDGFIDTDLQGRCMVRIN